MGPFFLIREIYTPYNEKKGVLYMFTTIITPAILVALYIYFDVAERNYDKEFKEAYETDWNEYYKQHN